ncbi:MAG TPA: hypothetical protein PKC49_02340 [Phycisphaerae bacterium]|nr:hypothetical protein [Phycisphaerae bacterium]
MKSAILVLSATAAILGFWSWSPIRPCQLMSRCHTTGTAASAADGVCVGAAKPCDVAGAADGAEDPPADPAPAGGEDHAAAAAGADASALEEADPAEVATAITPRPRADGRVLVAGLLSTNCCAYSAAIERVAAMQEKFGDRIHFVQIQPEGDHVMERLVEQWRPTWRPPPDGPAQPYVWQDTGAFRAGPGTFFVFDRDGYLVAPDARSDELEEAIWMALIATLDDC